MNSHWNNTESPIGKSTPWLFPGMGHSQRCQPFTPCLIGAWPGMITQQEKNSIHVLITKKPFFGGYHHFWKRHPARPLTISRVYELRLRWGNEFWREKNDRKTMSSTYHVWDVNFFKLCQGMWCEEYLLAHSSQFKVNWKRSSCRFRIGSWQLLYFLEDTILTSLSFTKDLVGWGSLLPRDVHGNFSSIPQGWQWKDGRMECRRGSGPRKNPHGHATFQGFQQPPIEPSSVIKRSLAAWHANGQKRCHDFKTNQRYKWKF